jgi:GNAT superfamily N-acetyltransferase
VTHATPELEIAKPADIAALAELRVSVGWYASSELLSAAVAYPRMRIWLVRAGAVDVESPEPSRIVASTSALAADGVGIVGNVVVNHEFRRRGLGRAITSAAIEWLEQRGVRSVLLDATSDGRPLYKHLGFVPVGDSWYLKVRLSELDRDRLLQKAGATTAAMGSVDHLAWVRSLDIAAFGGDRMGLVASMLGHQHNWLATSSDTAGEPAGYLVYGGLRQRSSGNTYGLHLGPLIARNQAVAAALLAAALGEDAPWRSVLNQPCDSEVEVRASVPGVTEEILAFYRSVGLPLVKDDVLMQLDPAITGIGKETTFLPYPGEARYVYAWLAPMCF